MGIERIGPRKAMLRKFNGEKKRVGINHGAVQPGGNGNNPLQQLMAIMQQNMNAAPVSIAAPAPVVAAPVKQWYKLDSNRKCFVGIVSKADIESYNKTCTALVLKSFQCTDATKMRAVMYGKTHSGKNDRVRCVYDERKMVWPYSNIKVLELILHGLERRKFIVIFAELDRTDPVVDDSSKYWARFGRNLFSVALALTGTLEGAKESWNWAKSISKSMSFFDFAQKTHDSDATRFKLCDFSGTGPDWPAFERWIASKPALRQAEDPMVEEMHRLADIDEFDRMAEQERQEMNDKNNMSHSTFKKIFNL